MRRIIGMLALMLAINTVQAADITNISGAFKGGNSEVLTKAMDKEVDLALPGQSKRCTASEAGKLLERFFTQQRPTGFTVVHHADKQSTGFFVGKLATASGELRVNVTYRAEGSKAVIQSIRIE